MFANLKMFMYQLNKIKSNIDLPFIKQLVFTEIFGWKDASIVILWDLCKFFVSLHDGTITQDWDSFSNTVILLYI